jgi:hypothetical protein
MLENDKKTIKQEILSKISLSISLFFFLNMIFILIASLEIGFGLLFLILIVVSVALCAFVFSMTTRKLRIDLKSGKVNRIVKLLINKEFKVDYEPGSATMPVTILSFLTPKIFNREMKQVDRYKAFFDDEEFLITKEEFDEITINKEVAIRKGFYSDLYLGIEKINYSQYGRYN